MLDIVAVAVAPPASLTFLARPFDSLCRQFGSLKASRSTSVANGALFYRLFGYRRCRECRPPLAWRPIHEAQPHKLCTGMQAAAVSSLVGCCHRLLLQPKMQLHSHILTSSSCSDRASAVLFTTE